MVSYVQQLWDDLRTRTGRNVGAAALGLYVAAAVGFLTAVLAARGLGPTGYGVIAVVFTFSELVLAFASVGSGEVTTRYVSSFRAEGRMPEARAISKLGYGVDFGAGLGTLLLMVLLLPLATSRMSALQGYGWIGVAYAASFPFSSLRGTNLAVLSSWGRYGQLAALEVGNRLLVLALTAIALRLRDRVLWVVLAAAIGPGLEGLLGAILASNILRTTDGRHWLLTPVSVLGPKWRQSLSGYGWTYLATTFQGALTGVPLLILAGLSGPVLAGYLKLGTTVFNVTSYLEAALVRVTYPVMSIRWTEGGDPTMLETMKRWTWRAGLPAAVAILVAIPFVPLAVPVVFGPSYAPMAAGLQILLLAAALSVGFFWLRNSYYVLGKIPAWTAALGASALLTLPLSWLGVRYWGYVGACWGIVAIRVGIVGVLIPHLRRALIGQARA